MKTGVTYEAKRVEVTFGGERIAGVVDLGIGRDYTAITTVRASVPLTVVGPVVVIDCERHEAMVGERLVRFVAKPRADGATIVRVVGVGTFVAGPGPEFSYLEPRFDFGSTRRRKARQVLYPLARAWCQQPQRGPRGRKTRGT